MDTPRPRLANKPDLSPPGEKIHETMTSNFTLKVEEMGSIFSETSPAPLERRLTRKAEERGKALLEYCGAMFDAIEASESAGTRSQGADPVDPSLVAYRQAVLDDLETFADSARLMAILKDLVLWRCLQWTTEAGQLDAVIRGLKEDMAHNDAELQMFHGNPGAVATVALRSRIDSIEASVRNCQSAAVSRRNSLAEILKGDEVGYAKGRLKVVGEREALLPQGTLLVEHLAAWKKLVERDIGEMERALSELRRVAAPFLEQNLFNDLESFRPYKLDSVTKAVDDARRALD